MSAVTSIVVTSRHSFDQEEQDEIGLLMFMVCYPQIQPPRPFQAVPLDVGDVSNTDGTKYPGGTVWWLGIKGSVDMERFVKVLDQPRFSGTTIWSSYEDEFPEVVTIGPPDTHRWGGR